MSRNSSREALLGALIDEIRAGQRATQLVDEAAWELMGVNRTDGRCLDILDQRGRLTAGQLATEARLSSGAVTAVIDRLEQAGYARRVADPGDRRRVLVEPTEKSHRVAEELMGRLGEVGGPKVTGYTDEQLELLLEFARFNRELQENHAEWLRGKLEERSASRGASLP